MDANRYKVFLKVVECGSFSQAAELTHYSQSGISRLVAELESEMGVKLLERRRAGVRLTSDGQMLMPRLKSVADELERLRISVDELNGLQSGILRIGVERGDTPAAKTDQAFQSGLSWRRLRTAAWRLQINTVGA